VLEHIDVSRIDRVFEIKQVAGGGLLGESVGDMIDNMFETDERPVNGISGWQFVESVVVPDKAMLEFPCDRTSAADVLVVAVPKAVKEVWWSVDSCSSRNSESVSLNSGTVSVAAAFNNSLTEFVLQSFGTDGHSFQALLLRT